MYGSLLQSIRSALRGHNARAAVWLLLAAVLLQFTVTRAHFHLSASQPLALAGIDLAGKGKPAPAPVHDQSNCPLWNAGNICGAALAAVTLSLFAPAARSEGAAVPLVIVAAERISAIWQSRAPPAL